MITYLMPIETTHRELDYKLMLAARHAAPHRQFLFFRQDLGPALVGHVVKRGVWVGQNIKTRTGERDDYRRLHALKEAGFSVVYIDEEGALVPGDEPEWKSYFAQRIDPRELAADDWICTWGSFQSRFYKTQTSGESSTPQIEPTGHPRFDLCRAPFNDYFSDDVGAIKRELGDFILINTNFSMANHIGGLTAMFTAREGYKNDDTAARLGFVKFWKHMLQTAADFVDVVHRLAVRFPATRFVVRPHPVENPELYYRGFAGVPNIVVRRDRVVIPWLRAARALIHNGCTTAIECRLAGTPIINYSPAVAVEAESWVANLFGSVANDYRSLEAAVDDAIAERHRDARVDPNRSAAAAALFAQFVDGSRPDDSWTAVEQALRAAEESARGAGVSRLDEIKLRAVAAGHGAGVTAKVIAGELKSRVSGQPVLARKFAFLSESDVDQRVARASRVANRSVTATVLSPTAMVVR